VQQKHIWQKALANPVAGIHLDMEIQAAGTILGVSPLGHVRHLHIHEASDAFHADAGHSSRIAPLGCSQFELLGAAQPMLPHTAQDHDAPSNSRPPRPDRSWSRAPRSAPLEAARRSPGGKWGGESRRW